MVFYIMLLLKVNMFKRVIFVNKTINVKHTNLINANLYKMFSMEHLNFIKQQYILDRIKNDLSTFKVFLHISA